MLPKHHRFPTLQAARFEPWKGDIRQAGLGKISNMTVEAALEYLPAPIWFAARRENAAPEKNVHKVALDGLAPNDSLPNSFLANIQLWPRDDQGLMSRE